MVSTNAAYINEFGFFDDMYNCLESTMNDMNTQFADFEIKKHSLEMRHYFEDVEDYDVLLEKEGEGVLAKIGNAILKIISKITGLIKSLMEKVFGNAKQIRTDEEIVNKMIKDHPELQAQIIKGINKEWFTVRDIAPFEKDITGLIQMLEKNAIDHQTFREKVAARCIEFTKSAAPFLGVATTAAGFLKAGAAINKGAVGTKEALQNLSKTCEEFKDRVDRNYGEKEVSKAQAIMNALGNVVGVTTKECERRAANQSAFAKFLNKIANSKAGKLVHADDESQHERQAKVKEKLDKKHEQEAKDKQDAYAAGVVRSVLKRLNRSDVKLGDVVKAVNEQEPGKYTLDEIRDAYLSVTDSKKNNKNKNKNNP